MVKQPVGEPELSSSPTHDSIYSHSQKWFLVGIVALAGLCSPLPATIYLPALPLLTSEFHRSVAQLNLSVTVYLVFQGVSPLPWGTLSDRWGRRPIIIACLAILAIASIGLARVSTSAFWLLLLLRCIQSAGCSSTIALGAGVIGDISTPKDRGGFFGLFTLGATLGPALGPILGGPLADHLGWRAIFWFLFIFATVCLSIIALFLPETLRSIVGDGSIIPPFIYRPFVPIFFAKGPAGPLMTKPATRKPFQNPLLIFGQLDLLLSLTLASVAFMVNNTFLTIIPSSFKRTYPHLSETSLGLCYIPTGVGMIFGSVITGKLLDRAFRRTKNRLTAQGRHPASEIHDITKAPWFPIESARLSTVPLYLFILGASSIGWGWCIEKKVSIAGPLILQIAVGYSAIAILNTATTLNVDLLPSQSSAVTACTNFARCSFAAILVAVVDPCIRRMGYGWTTVILGACCAVAIPLVYLEIAIGPRCRAQRAGISVAVVTESSDKPRDIVGADQP
ncbi:MFS general substrate transporter [Mycena floridula]|nr:MFS general substrate transporter [Mycena floridula]